MSDQKPLRFLRGIGTEGSSGLTTLFHLAIFLSPWWESARLLKNHKYLKLKFFFKMRVAGFRHPMKIKIGLCAPTKEQYKATGTDGTQSPGNKTQNLNEIKEGKLIPFSSNRVGSSTVGIGAPLRL